MRVKKCRWCLKEFKTDSNEWFCSGEYETKNKQKPEKRKKSVLEKVFEFFVISFGGGVD